MKEIQIAWIICSITSIIGLIMGFLIAFKTKLILIAGINKSNIHKIKNPKKLGKKIGIITILISLLIFIIPIFLYNNYFWIIFSILIIVSVVVSIIIVKQHT